jgi:hypothetical protein
MGELGLVERTAVAAKPSIVTIAREWRWPLVLWTAMVSWTVVLLALAICEG